MKTLRSYSLGFNPYAKEALELAEAEPTRRNHNFIGDEHLLFGIAACLDPLVGDIFENLGITLAEVRDKIRDNIGIGPDQAHPGETPCTPRVKELLQQAREEAVMLDTDEVCPIHILLAIMRDKDGTAATLIRQFGITLEDLERAFRVVSL